MIFKNKILSLTRLILYNDTMTDTIIKDIFFKQGDFVIITGPMFAGKSKLLIDLFYKQENVCAYGSVINTRDNSIKSRDYKDKEIHCQKIANPLDILKCDKEIVIIDEFQFLGPVESLKDIVNTLKEKKKIIIMAGLDLLANGAEWENYTVLKKICDKEIKLKAKCSICDKPASYTQMIAGDKKKDIQVESENVQYTPRCYEHFHP